jgi:ABC-2 type transport system ATP-binding protein
MDPLLVIEGLSKRFGPIVAVDDVSFTLCRGEVLGFLGPNGAGKSTTIDIMLGLMEPDAGEVSLFGLPPRDAIAAGTIGAMLQTGSLLRDVRVRELLTMMASLYPHPLLVQEAVSMTGIEDLADRRTETLSGGEAQRVRFAAAVVCDPELLVLDEPTTALDVQARRSFWATLRDFAARGTTVVFATHYLEEADAYADRVVLVASGRVVADGAPTRIKARVGSRIIRATLPDADLAALRRLPGVAAAERHGDAVVLRCSDSDAAVRGLIERHRGVRDIEITGTGLEEAFLELTAPAQAAVA